MTTETTENKERSYTKAGGSFPPMIQLEIGDTLEGQIQSVDLTKKTVTKKVKGKNVNEEKESLYYRVILETDIVCKYGKKQSNGTYLERHFKTGEVVTLPGSGSLDYLFRGVAQKIDGLDKDEDPNFDSLKGIFIKLTRLPDDTMKKGDFVGNPVKTYDLEYSK